MKFKRENRIGENMKYLLGIDLGTTAIKIGLFNQKGGKIATATQEYNLLTPSNFVVEQEVDSYWKAFKKCLAVVLNNAQINVNDIAALSFSVQGETLIVIDENGKPLRNAIVWMDNRAQEESDKLAAHFTNERIHSVTGQVSMQAMWPAAKILWIKNNEPEVFCNVYRFLLLEDYFIYRLIGKFVAEGSLLCSTILWDINTKKYWPEMLQYLGISEVQLPEIVEPGSSAGTLKQDVAAELGLCTDTLVVVGALDQACGAIGVGNVRPGTFSESTGGALAVVTIVNKPVFDKNSEIPCFYFGIPNHYMIHAFSTGGMAIRWLRDNLCTEEMRVGDLTGINAYALMDRAAMQIEPGSEGLIFLPYMQGSGPPDSNQAAKGVIFGLTLRHTKSHIIRALMESISVVLFRMIESIRAMGIIISEIRSLSGGAKSPYWCQMKADITGIPVHTMKNTEDAACLGAAILAGVAVGAWSSVSEAADSIVEYDREFLPDTSSKVVYDVLVTTYKKLFVALRDVF